MKAILASLFLSILAGAAAAQEIPSSFSASKKLLANIHEDIGHMKTVYCGCSYTRTTASGGDVDREACGLKARSDEVRSDRIEWEHVVPASWFGNTRACWQLKDAVYPECAGKTGRKCCAKVNEHFDLAYKDPNNLFPSSGEVNGDRSSHPFGEIEGEARVYGSCDFEVAKVQGVKVAEPADGAVRGPLARAMLYMAEVYGATVKLPMETVWKWHKDNPPAAWELERARRIADETGLRNNWILGAE